MSSFRIVIAFFSLLALLPLHPSGGYAFTLREEEVEVDIEEEETCTFEEGKGQLNLLRYMRILVDQKAEESDRLMANYVLKDWKPSLTSGRKDRRRPGRRGPGDGIQETQRLLAEGVRESEAGLEQASRAMAEYITQQTNYIQKRAEFLEKYPCYLRGSSGPQAIELANMFEIYALEDLFHGSFQARFSRSLREGEKRIDLLKDGTIQEYQKALLDTDSQKRDEGRAIFGALFIEGVQFASADLVSKLADRFLSIVQFNAEKLREAGKRWARRQYLRLHFEILLNLYDAVKFVDVNHPLKDFFLKHKRLFLKKNREGKRYNPLFFANPFGAAFPDQFGIYLIYPDFMAVGYYLFDAKAEENPRHARPQDLFSALEGGYLGRGSCFFSYMAFDPETKILFCRSGLCNDREARAEFIENGILPRRDAFRKGMLRLVPKISSKEAFLNALCSKDLSSREIDPWIQRVIDRGLLPAGEGSGGGDDGGGGGLGIGCADMGSGGGIRDNLLSCVFSAQAASRQGGAAADAIETALGPPCLSKEASASIGEDPPIGEEEWGPEEWEDEDWEPEEEELTEEQQAAAADIEAQWEQHRQWALDDFSNPEFRREVEGQLQTIYGKATGGLALTRAQLDDFWAKGEERINNAQPGSLRAGSLGRSTPESGIEIDIGQCVGDSPYQNKSPGSVVIDTIVHEGLHYAAFEPPPPPGVSAEEWDDFCTRLEHIVTDAVDLGSMCAPDSPCSNNSCTASAAGMLDALAECLWQHDPRLRQMMAAHSGTYGRINPGVEGENMECDESSTDPTRRGHGCLQTDCGGGRSASLMAGGAGCGCGGGSGWGSPPLRPGDDPGGAPPPSDPAGPDCFTGDCGGGGTPPMTLPDRELDRTFETKGILKRIFKLFD